MTKNIMWILFVILLTALLAGVIFLMVTSPGKPRPVVDDAGNPVQGSISEKVFVQIGGIKQGMFIRSTNPGNPVLLFLHGGMPEYFLDEKYPSELERHFTVAWWEQRGSGISFSADIPAESLTSEQMIEDALEVTAYLRRRFGQEKIYLMAHSGGTFIGIQAAARAPQLFHAYIGVAQIVDQLESERLAHAYMVQQYEKDGNEKMVRKLKSAPVGDDTPIGYLKVRDKAMHELGIGTMRDMKSVVTGMFLPSLTSRAYTFREKLNMWRGKSRSGVSSLWNEILATNLMNKVTQLEIPVYFFSGAYDYTVSPELSEKYFKHLSAPLKGYYTFARSAHSPIYEESDNALRILAEDVLTGTNRLADIK